MPGVLSAQRAKNGIRWFTLAITVVVFLITAWMAMPRPQGAETAQFSLMEPAVKQMQDLFSVPWIKSFNIYYLMGIDGISFPLVILTSFICMLAMGASWKIEKHVKAYCILFLLLETGMIGVFLALDFFLFYVFWEVMLLADVLFDRRLGRSAEGVRCHQVFLVHAFGQRADADRNFDFVFQQRFAAPQRAAIG